MKYISILSMLIFSNFSLGTEVEKPFGLHIIEKGERLEYLSNGFDNKNILPSEFNLMVWNILKGRRENALRNTLPNYLSRNDISLIQEYESNSYLHDILSNEKIFSVAGFTHQKGSNESTKAGVLIYSKFRAIDNSCKVLHSKEREFGLTPKATLLCKFKMLNDKELLVINVHAINFQVFNFGSSNGFGFGQAYRNQIAQWDEVIKSHTGPIIFAGDFNTWNPLKRRLDRILEMLNNNSDGTKKGSFIHIKNYKTYSSQKILTLDHIFYRGLQIVDTPISRDAKLSSDHNPLFVKFKGL